MANIHRTRDKVLALFQSGKYAAQIARELHMSRSAVSQHMKSLNLTPVQQRSSNTGSTLSLTPAQPVKFLTESTEVKLNTKLNNLTHANLPYESHHTPSSHDSASVSSTGLQPRPESDQAAAVSSIRQTESSQDMQELINAVPAVSESAPGYNERKWDRFDTAAVIGTAVVVGGCLVASVLLKNKQKHKLEDNNSTIGTTAANTNTETISPQPKGYGTSFFR